MSGDQELIADLVKRRKALGVHQIDLVSILSISTSTISRREAGKRKASRDELIAWGAALGLELREGAWHEMPNWSHSFKVCDISAEHKKPERRPKNYDMGCAWARRYRGGESITQIAASEKRDRLTVSKAIRRAGVTTSRQHVTDEQRQDWARRYMGGETLGEIANAEEVSISTVAYNLKKQDVERRKGGKVKLTADDKLNIGERYRAGARQLELAESYGVSRDTIAVALRKLGITKRKGKQDE